MQGAEENSGFWSIVARAVGRVVPLVDALASNFAYSRKQQKRIRQLPEIHSILGHRPFGRSVVRSWAVARLLPVGFPWFCSWVLLEKQQTSEDKPTSIRTHACRPISIRADAKSGKLNYECPSKNEPLIPIKLRKCTPENEVL